MQRRNLLQLFGAAAALPLLPGGGDALQLAGTLHAREARDTTLRRLSPDQAALVTLLGDMIIPRTDTPGASDVNVTEFIDHLLAEWYHPDEVDPFLAGLEAIDARARTERGRRFVDLAEADRVSLLTDIDRVKGREGSAEATFARLKSLTVYSYFTSELVMTTVTREPIIPGRFDGCVGGSRE